LPRSPVDSLTSSVLISTSTRSFSIAKKSAFLPSTFSLAAIRPVATSMTRTSTRMLSPRTT
jgi:hypothetical protein